MSAAELLEALRRLNLDPSVVGEELVLDDEPPPHLGAALVVLHVGVRAALTGKRLFGFDATGRPCPAPLGVMNPRALLPRGLKMVQVEGDSRWHRIPHLAIERLPRLFAAEESRTAKTAGKPAEQTREVPYGAAL